jgi:hypothetical protein
MILIPDGWHLGNLRSSSRAFPGHTRVDYYHIKKMRDCILDFVDVMPSLKTSLICLRCRKLCSLFPLRFHGKKKLCLLLTFRSVVFICYVCQSTIVQLLTCFLSLVLQLNEDKSPFQRIFVNQVI